MPPGRRRSGGTARSGSGDDRRIERRRRVLDRDDDPVVDELGGDIEPPGPPAVAVDDDVGRGLVDGLDEVVDAHRGRVARGRHIAHERADLGQPIEVGRDPQVSASCSVVTPSARTRPGSA